ncbi:MAG: DUF4190 domain-containing protein [Lachnospiraceae bacterium]|nr:DUF4190 domain-containing protein [Lachnospiraceae bacterium]
MDYNQNNYDNNQTSYENDQSGYNNEQNYNDSTYYGNDNYAGGYNDPYNYTPGPQSESGMGIASMVLGICAFFINPFALCSVLAIIFGIIGACKQNAKKGCAIAGIILGGITIIWDFILTIFSGGLLLFC